MPNMKDLIRSVSKKHPSTGIFLRFIQNHSSFFKLLVHIFTTCFLLFSIWYFRESLITAFTTSLSIKWNILYLPVLFLLWNALATLAWKGLIQSDTRFNFSFIYLFTTRIQSQALNFILPFFGIGGELLRSAKIAKPCGIQHSIISVTTDKVTDIISDILLTAIGIVAASSYLPYSIFFVSISIVFLLFIITFFFSWKQSALFLAGICPQKAIRKALCTFARNVKMCSASKSAFLYHCIEHVLMACEIFLISHFIGINLSLPQLLLVNAISSIFGFVFFFIPGRVGSYECSLAYAFSLLSLSPTAGLSVALIRRARQSAVCLAGIFLSINVNKFFYRKPVVEVFK